MSNSTPTEDVVSIPATVAVLDGGIGLNWLPKSLPRDVFKRVLFDMLRYAGFREPRTVAFVRNRIVHGASRVDYWRLRIEASECQMQGVNPVEAVRKMQQYLRTSHGVAGVEFDVQ